MSWLPAFMEQERQEGYNHGLAGEEHQSPGAALGFGTYDDGYDAGVSDRENGTSYGAGGCLLAMFGMLVFAWSTRR